MSSSFSSCAAAVPHTWGFLSLWIFGGLIALCAAFTFAELGAAIPKTGGWFVFLREGFGRYPAFLFAWVVLLVVSTGASPSPRRAKRPRRPHRRLESPA